MKEDILEQLVEDYFQRRGYFTLHNVKFRPGKERPDYQPRQDSVHSDIDVLAYHPQKCGVERVVAVNCKSWQGGFEAEQYVERFKNQKKESNGRPIWKYFRELMDEKWAESFAVKIKELTGTKEFTHYTAVTVLKAKNNDEMRTRMVWQNECSKFTKTMRENPIRILTLREILDELWNITGTTMAESEVGRLLQVIKASGWNPPDKK
ncbi:MAG: NERD domain-containing protein [Gammaproteobacteria bacterium]|nr:NERD domain-containing protein [Gammaproteobacteria bacterium]